MHGYRHPLRRFAAVVTASAAVTVALTGTASAATPKVLCNLVVDPIGDTTPQSPQLDIRGADIESNNTDVRAVLRLHSLSASDPVAATGAAWYVRFTVSGRFYAFSLKRDATGTFTASFGARVGGVTVVPAVFFDPTRNEIRFAVPRAAVPELPPTADGTTSLTNVGGITTATPYGTRIDDAYAPQPYTDGQPTCI